MTGWDIAPAGVRLVIAKVRESADGMNDGIDLYGKSVQAAMTAAGTLSFGDDGAGGGDGRATGLVAVALGEFAKGIERDVAFLPLRASDSANGAVEATNAYVTGSLEQAWNAQHAALQVPDVSAVLKTAHKKGHDAGGGK
ncbi:DUF6507 family protein [Streptomyces sp. NPDC052496]|uniref:DUF6507 family protein n=1 Tax=Streptomyces sp. NPDC052496 TaxID=3154951 RepID=UPI00342BF8AB